MNSYFSHDADAMNDPKCMLLISQLGMEGYGIFWALVEMLRTQDGYRLHIALIPAIANRFGVQQAKLEAVIKGYGLFMMDDETFFYSQSLLDRMELMDAKSLKRKNAGKLGGIAKAAKKIGAKTVDNLANPSNAKAMPEQSQSNALANSSNRKTFIFNTNINTNIEYKKEEKENMGASNDATFSRMELFYLDVCKFQHLYNSSMLQDFFDYWSELDTKGKKMKFELNKTWETEKRLRTWEKKAKEFGSHSKKPPIALGAAPVSKMQQMITTIEDSVNQVGYE